MLLHDTALWTPFFRSSHQRCSIKKGVLRILQNSQENTCVRVNFIKKETLAQVFSCEFCKISKNTFFTEHHWTTASSRFEYASELASKVKDVSFLSQFEYQR